MRVTSRVPQRFHTRNVHILRRREHHRVFRHFVIIKRELLLRLQPGIQHHRRNRSMIAMRIDRPLGEHHVRLLLLQLFPELFVMRCIHNRAAVVLPRKCGMRLQDRASFLRFARSYPSALLQVALPAIPFPTVQIKQHHLVSPVGITSDSPRATALRITRVPSSHHHFQFAFWLSIRIKRCRQHFRLSTQCTQRSQLSGLHQYFASRHSQWPPRIARQHTTARCIRLNPVTFAKRKCRLNR